MPDTNAQSEWSVIERTDTGERAQNEDYVLHMRHPEDPQLLLAVVADGMGGQAGGFQASRIAVDAVTRVFVGQAMTAEPRALLDQAAQAAHQEIRDLAQANPAFEKAGTTLMMVLARRGTLFHGHVGDSRLYRLRGEEYQALTEDHSWVRLLIEQGEITEDEAETDERRHVLSQAVGSTAEIRVEVHGPVEVRPEDRFLLCSDGLYSVIPDAEVGTCLGGRPAKDALDWMIEETLRRGAHDNVTVQILSRRHSAMVVPAGAKTTAPVPTIGGDARPPTDITLGGDVPSPTPGIPRPALVLGIVLVLAALAIVTLALRHPQGPPKAAPTASEPPPAPASPSEPTPAATSAPPASGGVQAISPHSAEQLSADSAANTGADVAEAARQNQREAQRAREGAATQAAAEAGAPTAPAETPASAAPAADWAKAINAYDDALVHLEAEIASLVQTLTSARTVTLSQHNLAQNHERRVLAQGDAKAALVRLEQNRTRVNTLMNAGEDAQRRQLGPELQVARSRLARLRALAVPDPAQLDAAVAGLDVLRTGPALATLAQSAAQADALARDSETAHAQFVQGVSSSLDPSGAL